MKLGRCPVCKSHISAEAVAQDEASRALLAKVAMLNSRLASPLLSYIGLFRPEKSDLSPARSLKLINECLAMTESTDSLIEALNQTTSQLHTKRQREGYKPLKNHGYLKQVLDSVMATTPTAAQPQKSDAVEVKSPTQTESQEESRRIWEEQMKKWGTPNAQS